MDAKEIVELVKEHLKEVKIAGPRRVFATVDKTKLREVLKILRSKDIQHISDITGIDLGEKIGVIYRIDCMPVFLNLKIELPKSDTRFQTVTDIFPGAILFERDLMEMIGVKFEGHPDPRKLFLPDDWPEGVYPLRKETNLREALSRETAPREEKA